MYQDGSPNTFFEAGTCLSLHLSRSPETQTTTSKVLSGALGMSEQCVCVCVCVRRRAGGRTAMDFYYPAKTLNGLPLPMMTLVVASADPARFCSRGRRSIPQGPDDLSVQGPPLVRLLVRSAVRSDLSLFLLSTYSTIILQFF